MQYDIIMNLYFYDFQNVLESYSKIIEERRKEEESEMKRQGYDTKNYSPESIQKNMPKVPKMEIPKFKI